MGMFDDLVAWSDHFSEGDPFTLEAARVGTPIKTSYGTDAPAMLKIGGKWYSIFGSGLVSQIERMEDGDLPSEVKIIRVPTRSGNDVKKLVEASAPAPSASPDPATDIADQFAG